jgi:phospholipase C
VDTQVHDHASVPATLRTLFAPDAKPLTARDAWSAPFHTLASLDQPRTDVPDLSAHTVTPPEPAALVATVATTPAEVTAKMPQYYREFSDQAELMLEHLQEVGEPEAAAPIPPGGIPRSSEITETFEAAAERHRL